MQVYIRETNFADLNGILKVEREAFNSPKEAALTSDLLADPTAQPLLSLLAFVDEQPAGHILFTTAHLPNAPAVVVSILAPLAVLPQFQKQGVGGSLIKTGLALQSKNGVDVVFVLGHPTYYPRHGFTPAGKHGFKAPYPIPEKDTDAWMVQALRPNIIGSISGNVVCCEALDKPEHWRE
ncbi:MAG: N-acetyltransferase [Candidatus Bathyarchaeota archaeon]|nr:N-acetyltransferase [Candidatus Bathyarchaeota archaeon]